MPDLRPRSVLLFAGLVFGIFAPMAGCGKRGPLYLPDGAGAQSVQAVKPAPSPADKGPGDGAQQ